MTYNHPLNHISCQISVRCLTCSVFIMCQCRDKEGAGEQNLCSLLPISNNVYFKLNVTKLETTYHFQFTIILLIGISQEFCYGLRVSVCGLWGFLNSCNIQPSSPLHHLYPEPCWPHKPPHSHNSSNLYCGYKTCAGVMVFDLMLCCYLVVNTNTQVPFWALSS